MNPNTPSRRSKSRLARILTISTTASSKREKSAWSPVTPPPPSPPSTARSFLNRFSHARTRSDDHHDTRSPSPPPLPPLPPAPVENRLRSAFGRILREPASPTLPTISNPIPIQGYGSHNFEDLPSFSPLPLSLKSEQRDNSVRYNPNAARKKKRRNIYIGAGVLGAVILAVVIILIVRLAKSSRTDSDVASEPSETTSGTASPTATPSTSNLLTPEQSKCLDDYAKSAPSAPLDYPTACLQILQSIPAKFVTEDPAGADLAESAKQFVALRLLFNGCSASAQQGLTAGGWFKDIKFCLWSGVQCGGTGVRELTLTAPNVPDTISADGIAALTSLSTFIVKGSGNSPSGSLPKMPPSILDLELSNTALDPLDFSLFTGNGGSSTLDTLVLVQNSKMGSIPDGLINIPLRSLTIQSQNISSLPPTFFTSPLAQTLRVLDLSGNTLSGTVPDTSSLSNVVSLNLGSNAFTTISESTNFPPNLQIVSFLGNHDLAGVLPRQLCESSGLQSCDFTQTVFSDLPGASCGVCKFN